MMILKFYTPPLRKEALIYTGELDDFEGLRFAESYQISDI